MTAEMAKGVVSWAVLVTLAATLGAAGCIPDLLHVGQTAVEPTALAASTPPGEAPSARPLPGLEYTAIHPTPLQGTYLSNPGIGWQMDGDGKSSVGLPEAVAYALRRSVSWNVLNPAPGKYEWFALDAGLAQAAAKGEQFSFRVYTMAGGGFGGQRIPAWVRSEGAALLPSGEPDYSNCVYQQRWGEFVTALIQRYDGSPGVAFIDISGYGNFNEWSWQDQTHWDETWKDAVDVRAPNPAAFQSLDGQARRRLADMFIGGSFRGHACRDHYNRIRFVDYAYNGFHRTQLIMPFAGINQSTQYVYSRRADVGFRYDCLGRSQDERLVLEAAKDVWKRAPVVFELCDPSQFSMESARTVMQQAHGSLIHANGDVMDPQGVLELLMGAGYRYALKEAAARIITQPARGLSMTMVWQNLGSAPSYRGMGQAFQLRIQLVEGPSGRNLIDEIVPVEISSWMPAEDPRKSPPENEVHYVLSLPQGLQAGSYELRVAIIDQRTGLPVQLGFQGADDQGRYLIGRVDLTH